MSASEIVAAIETQGQLTATQQLRILSGQFPRARELAVSPDLHARCEGELVYMERYTTHLPASCDGRLVFRNARLEVWR